MQTVQRAEATTQRRRSEATEAKAKCEGETRKQEKGKITDMLFPLKRLEKQAGRAKGKLQRELFARRKREKRV
ncbi:hypothetical protein V1477_000310 [Vespula maculifrons]|uniref:Uncharacterized protein n=2 Tax=Vespula TaxID=7451 RepID=A0A834JDB7_VESVU|nr:hypothetical protein HZH66_012075 [Vespula vulgaris]